MRTICVLSAKRGAGKTSVIVNLGACLADQGRKVLMIDLDPKGGLSLALGAKTARGTFEVLSGQASLTEAIQKKWGMDLIVGHPNLSGFHGEATALRNALGGVRYDYVFLDMPPLPGILTYNAFSCAQEVFIVTEAEPESQAGLERVIDSVSGLRKTYNPHLSVSGIIITHFDPEQESQYEAERAIRNDYGALVFRTYIRYSSDLIETIDQKQPVIFYRSTGGAAEDYRSLARELESRESSMNQFGE
ncbi:MAG: ParA family protein [Candidatus Aureabacteria bacterium]|nr:ParA family protein [Candidatus Auribacterota bacterium]